MTEKGEFVAARYGKRFTFSLLNIKENLTLKPGKYVVMIDPLWNDFTNNDPMYREVLLDIYAPESVDLDQLSDQKGMAVLEKAMKHAAKTQVGEESKQYYLQQNEDYGDQVYRISDVEALSCWYGFIYTMNNSPYELRETIRPTLEGLEVVYPPLEGEEGTDVELQLAAGDDHVVILRRILGSCTYGLHYLTHPRMLSDQEIFEQTAALDDEESISYFDDNQTALYKLMNTAQFACFYFENGSPDLTLTARFSFGLENLYIVGEAEDAESFEIILGPGKSCYKMLRPISDGVQTGIQMRYEFSFS